MARWTDEFRIGRKKAVEDQFQPTVRNTVRKLSRLTKIKLPDGRPSALADNVVQFSFGAFQFIEAPDAQVVLFCVIHIEEINYYTRLVAQEAEFEITVPRGPVTGFYGEPLILPCTFPVDSWDLSSVLILWQRGLDVVHSFYYSRDQLDRQNRAYVNRTSLFIQDLAGGNASLKLDRVTLQDSGVYTCSISTNTGSQKKSFRVDIAAFYSEPRLQFSMLTDGVSLLVTSDGGYPAPKLQWLMETLDITDQTQTHIMKDTQTGLYIVSSWIDLTEVKNCSLTFILNNKPLGQDIRREIVLYSDKSERQGESAYRWHGWFLIVVILLLIVIALLLVLLFCFNEHIESIRFLRRSKSEQTGSRVNQSEKGGYDISKATRESTAKSK
ncbi:CD276 antigen [Anabarilius grahami]|uniref:CD276 antigen n=1 Tax=Anabarilius grahami TaxID=495550 RepID=A0A3N0XE10_ANAGA|nr:CD276 antigen [Anabarilius grahami]